MRSSEQSGRQPRQCVGPCAVIDTRDRMADVKGMTIGKEPSTADAWMYDVRLNDAMLVRLAYLRWANGEREVRTLARSQWCTDYAACPVNLQLINGDADGDNQVPLFDYLVLDGAFGQPHDMADLDGDGQVTLFDYLIIDGSFGAIGD